MHLFPGVFSLDVWRKHHGIRDSLISEFVYIRICPGALTDSGSPARLVSGVPVCLHHHSHGKPPHHVHSDL